MELEESLLTNRAQCVIVCGETSTLTPGEERKEKGGIKKGGKRRYKIQFHNPMFLLQGHTFLDWRAPKYTFTNTLSYVATIYKYTLIKQSFSIVLYK